MIFRGFLFLIFIFICLVKSYAQDKVKVSGNIYDEYEKRVVVGVSIILQKSNLTYSSDDKGNFSFYCNKDEEIILFMYGYKTTKISLKDSAEQKDYQLQINFNRLMGTISKPIIIRPSKSLDQIAEERKKLGEIPRELQKQEVSWTSPISALYEMLSDRAKEKAKLREQIVEDQRRRIYKELFAYYREANLMDLPEEYTEEFIDFLGLPVEFLKDNTDYEITRVILTQYKKFGYEKGFFR